MPDMLEAAGARRQKQKSASRARVSPGNTKANMTTPQSIVLSAMWLASTALLVAPNTSVFATYVITTLAIACTISKL
ncbi:MAG: hypothetical protein K0Q92_646 [Steroidobacteraceae bacterium]|jgi:hypothetical protein|nr:hypothetical protein [Steroidobacteraceae bacterium]